MRTMNPAGEPAAGIPGTDGEGGAGRRLSLPAAPVGGSVPRRGDHHR